MKGEELGLFISVFFPFLFFPFRHFFYKSYKPLVMWVSGENHIDTIQSSIFKISIRYDIFWASIDTDTIFSIFFLFIILCRYEVFCCTRGSRNPEFSTKLDGNRSEAIIRPTFLTNYFCFGWLNFRVALTYFFMLLLDRAQVVWFRFSAFNLRY